MRRLIFQQFTFEKQRYLLTLDTDDRKLILKCYKGSSEKSAPAKIPKKFTPFYNKLVAVITEHSSILRDSLIHSPDTISIAARRAHNIQYPESTKFAAFKERIQTEGILRFESKDKPDDVAEYLEWHEVKFVQFEFEGQHIFVSSTERMQEFRLQIGARIKELQKLQEYLFDLSYKLN
jgi:hypothetical protein